MMRGDTEPGALVIDAAALPGAKNLLSSAAAAVPLCWQAAIAIIETALEACHSDIHPSIRS